MLFTTNISIIGGKEVGRLEKFKGTEYLVFPVIAANVGVMNGLFYTEEFFNNTVKDWNGVPVTLQHPTANGKHVSVEKAKEFIVGFFNNVSYVKEDLKGEVWLEKGLVEKNHPELIQILNSEQVDVSTGLFIDTFDETGGRYNGKAFERKVNDGRPDHLALLPNEAGACSWKDGCGIRFNCAGDSCSCGGVCKVKDLETRTNEALRQKYHGGLKVKEVTNNFCVYEDTKGKFFKVTLDYNSKSDVLTIGDHSEEVLVEYKPLPQSNEPKTNKHNMKPQEQLVSVLIANGESVTDERKKAIESLSDENANQLLTNALAGKKPEEPKKEEKPKEEPKANAESPFSLAEQAQLKALLANQQDEKDAKAKKVAELHSNISEEEAKGYDEKALDALLSSKGVTNFSLAAGSVLTPNKGKDEQPYTPPSILLLNEDEKKKAAEKAS